MAVPRLVRVVIADDHAVFRRGLFTVLGHEPDIAIVGEAGDGTEAVAVTLRLRPDVVLMDVRMPGRSGIEACRQIRDEAPETRVLMLTSSSDDADFYNSVSAGAAGYLQKQGPVDDLADAVRAVSAGLNVLAPPMTAKLMAEFAAMVRRRDGRTRAPRLTPREIEVLQSLATGHSNREIARTLFISENTVRSHVQSILDKLEVSSRTEAALYAIRERLVALP